MRQQHAKDSCKAGAWGLAAVALAVVMLPLKAMAIPALSLSEVFYDRVGTDNRFEWVELYNAGDTTIGLDTWSLGYGGTSYAQGGFQLRGEVAPRQYFVAGGPFSDASNAFPAFDLALDFSPDLQNSGRIADGVALFDVPVQRITSTLPPVDAVIFGGTNRNGLLAPDGSPGPVMVEDAPHGQSIELVSTGLWRVQPLPNPGRGMLGAAGVPEPLTLVLFAMGLALLSIARIRDL